MKSSFQDVTAGARLPWEALRLLRRERRLWGPALVPLLITLVALGATIAWVAARAGWLFDRVTGLLPVVEPTLAFSLLWMGPAWLLLKLAAVAGFLAAIALALVLAYTLASVLASPFLEQLSRRVEALLAGRVDEVEASGLRGVARVAWQAIRHELARTVFFVGIQLAILAASVLIPPLAPFAPLLSTLLTMLFLPLDHAAYVLDRRAVPFSTRRRWVSERAPLMLGFGATSFAMMIVPGVNLLSMPILVVAGTLLALRHGPGSGSTIDREPLGEKLPHRLESDAR